MYIKYDNINLIRKKLEKYLKNKNIILKYNIYIYIFKI